MDWLLLYLGLLLVAALLLWLLPVALLQCLQSYRTSSQQNRLKNYHMRTSNTPTPSKFGELHTVSWRCVINWPNKYVILFMSKHFGSPKCTSFDEFVQNPLPQGSTQRTSSLSHTSNWPRRDYHHGNSKWEELHHTDKDSEHSYPGNKPSYPRTTCGWNYQYTSELVTNYQHWTLAHTHIYAHCSYLCVLYIPYSVKDL